LHSLQCNPSYVSILIGTNDIKGIYKPEWGAGTLANFGLADPVGYNSFRKYLKSIVGQYIAADPHSKVAVHTLPPMGEDLSSRANGCVRKANEIIFLVAKGFEGTGRVEVVDTYGALSGHLRENSTREAREGSLKVDDFSSVGPEALIKHNLMGYSYDSIGRRFGLTVMVDALHLNETGARIVADGVGGWLRAALKKG
jgi:lysophospholipase L1-like esterase